MEKIVVNDLTQNLSDEICVNALKKANFYPVDRYFLNNYINKILNVNKLEFIFYNLESVSNTYTVQLFCCLPELWNNIKYEDLLLLIKNFSNIHSFFAFIEFTYKFLEIDTIEIVLNSNEVSIENKIKLYKFLVNQYPNLIKNEDTLIDFSKEYLGIDFREFEYLKQKILLDERIQPSAKTMEELRNQLEQYKI